MPFFKVSSLPFNLFLILFNDELLCFVPFSLRPGVLTPLGESCLGSAPFPEVLGVCLTSTSDFCCRLWRLLLRLRDRPVLRDLDRPPRNTHKHKNFNRAQGFLLNSRFFTKLKQISKLNSKIRQFWENMRQKCKFLLWNLKFFLLNSRIFLLNSRIFFLNSRVESTLLDLRNHF